MKGINMVLVVDLYKIGKITLAEAVELSGVSLRRMPAIKLREKITKLSSEVFDALARLRELSDLPKDDFLTDTHLSFNFKEQI